MEAKEGGKGKGVKKHSKNQKRFWVRKEGSTGKVARLGPPKIGRGGKKGDRVGVAQGGGTNSKGRKRGKGVRWRKRGGNR